MVVRNLEHLKVLSNNKSGDFEDFYILIANGFARSSKRILYHSKFDEFSLINEKDESFQEFHSSEIETTTNLVNAIKSKSLFKG